MKYVVVTGAYGGMGKAVTSLLKNSGFFVFALDKVVGDKEENVMPIEVDITNVQSIENAVDIIKNTTDSLYAILHFAGIYALDSLVEMDEERFTRIFNVNLFGAYRINKALFCTLKSGSRIILTTSELATLSPLPFTGIYALTKIALDKYAYSLRMEVQVKGVKVSVLRPGAVDTGMISVSTTELDRFCERTKYYKVNATRFKNIVNKVEAKKVSPEKIAKKTLKILMAKHPKQSYKINQNKLLLLLNALPKKLQTSVIKKVIK